MNPRQSGPRFEHQEKFAQLVSDSPTLAERYPQLKSLVLELGYFNAEGVSRNSHIKFVPNLTHARTAFRIACPNHSCVGGDFDLTDELATAVAERKTRVNAEKSCGGWQNKTTIDKVHCHNLLRYTLRLSY